MIFLQATERDYERATKQTNRRTGKATTSGAKFLNFEKYNDKEDRK